MRTRPSMPPLSQASSAQGHWSRLFKRAAQTALIACNIAFASVVAAQNQPAPKPTAAENPEAAPARAAHPIATPPQRADSVSQSTTTGGSSGQRPTIPFDFDADGVPDTVRREMRLEAGELLFSRFVVVSGATGLDLDAFPAPGPNDLFGWIVATVGDLDADTVPDLAVAAPRAHTGIPGDGVRGRVWILSGATHDTLLTIDGDWWGFSGLGLVVVDDQDGDGILDLLIGGMQRIIETDPGSGNAPDGDGALFGDPPTDEPTVYFHATWSLHSLGAGEVLESGEGVPPVRFLRAGESVQALWDSGPIPGERLWLEGASGDLNADGIVDMQDLLRLIEALSDPDGAADLSHYFQTGDLNADGAVDMSDLTALLAQYGRTAQDLAHERATRANPPNPRPTGAGAAPADCTDEFGFSGGGGCYITCVDCSFTIPIRNPPGGGCSFCPPGCPGCTHCPDCPDPPPDCTSQCECYPCSCDLNGNGTPDKDDDDDGDGILNKDDCNSQCYSGPAQCEVAFAASEEAISSVDEALLLLPGDTESVQVTFRVPCGAPAFLTTSNPAVASIFVNNDTHEETSLEGSPASVKVIGLSAGITYLELRQGSADGPVCGSLKIRVGGSIRIQYDRAPSFRPYLDGQRPPTPAARRGEPGLQAFELGLGPRPGIQPGLAPIILAETTPSVATFRIRIEDADGNPRENKEVKLAFRENKIVAISSTVETVTDAKGEVTFLLRSNIDGKRPQEWGVEIDNAAVLIGRTARDFSNHYISEVDVDSARTVSRCPKHKFGGYYLEYSATFIDAHGDKHILMASLDIPLINQLQDAICTQAFEGRVYTPPIDFVGEPISILDPDTDELVEIDGGIPADIPMLDLERFTAELGLIDELRERHEQNPNQQDVEFLADIRPPDLEDTPPGWTGKLVTYGAIAAELAIAMVPGGDLLDIFREFFWKPFFKNERPDTVVGAIALVGFALDAGWLAGPLGAAANFGAGALKTIFKFIPHGLAMAMLRSGDTIVDTVSMVANLIGRIPTPPGTSGLTASIHQVQSFANMGIQAMNSSLQLTGTHIAGAFAFFFRRFTGHYSQEALEGMGYLQKLGRHQVAEQIADEFAEEVVDATLGVVRSLSRFEGVVSDEAIRGIAVAIDQGVPAAVMHELLQATTMSGPRANQALTNFSRLQGVDGLDRLVIATKNQTAGADQLEGLIFEGTSAVRIRNGEVPGAAGLVSIGIDPNGSLNKADILTEAAFVQVKHKRDNAAFDISYFGYPESQAIVKAEIYVETMLRQAHFEGKQPIWITNGGVTGRFQDLVRTIEDRLIGDGIHTTMQYVTLSDALP